MSGDRIISAISPITVTRLQFQTSDLIYAALSLLRLSSRTLRDIDAVPLSPFLDGVHVPEEQQDLPGAALGSLREEQVVPGDTQRPSARRVQRLLEDHILHVGRLDVLRKLHSSFWASLRNSCYGLEITSSSLVRK